MPGNWELCTAFCVMYSILPVNERELIQKSYNKELFTLGPAVGVIVASAASRAEMDHVSS